MIPKVAAAALAGALSFTGAAYAQDAAIPSSPDFSESAGQWDIEGFAFEEGNTIICKMQKEAADGSPFADIMMMSAGSGGLTVVDAYITETALPEGSAPKVAIYFDGKKTTELTGGVKKGYLHVDVAKLDPLAMGRITQLLRNSKGLVEIATLEGYPSEKIMVDLTDADAAFTKRGMCSKAVLDVGMERMRRTLTEPQASPPSVSTTAQPGSPEWARASDACPRPYNFVADENDKWTCVKE